MLKMVDIEFIRKQHLSKDSGDALSELLESLSCKFPSPGSRNTATDKEK